MSNSDFLAKEKMGKLILKFSIPCILSLLISALYNIVDQIFIGNSDVGSIGNTATTIVFPLTTIALAFGLLLGDGAAAYMSICLGRGEKEKLNKAVGTSILTSFIISMLFLIIGLTCLDPILECFGAKTAEALEKAHEYGFIIVIGFPFYIMMNTLNSIIRADNAPKIAMISMVSGAVINVVLDYVLIMVVKKGLFGAALATILGQVISFVISAIYMFFTKTFKLNIKDFIPDFRALGEVCKLGFSSFLTQIAIVIVSVVSMNMLATYGVNSKYGVNDPQAIVGVVMKVFSIVVNIVVGIAAGAQPVIGYNYGAEQYNRVKKGFTIVLISTICVGLIATLLFQTIPTQIVGLFGANTSNKELYFEFGEKTVRIYLMLITFTCVQKVSSIFLQSISSPIKATALSLIRDIIAFVPLTICLPIGMGIEGVLWAAPISDAISIVFTIILLTLEFRKINNKEKQLESNKVESAESN
jgi:putative MATE family efflux protein